MCIRSDLPTGQARFVMHENQNVAHHAVSNGLWNTKSILCFSTAPHSIDDALVSAAPCRLQGKRLAVDMKREQHRKLTCRRERSL